jgi:hypothetical protein
MRIIRKSAACLKLASRRPEFRRIIRSSALIKKHAIRGTVLSLVPSEVTDVIVHHAHITVDEVVRVAADSFSTSAVGTAMSITLTAMKYL